uniref:non-specific serine/threonine protein kinase n=1 Tax=Crassostrea virginica TaxID=6565 RepID=A0A8B8D424_CRAVI|nr:myosin-IIIb-like isoform X3 [Crassostrea virginica]
MLAILDQYSKVIRFSDLPDPRPTWELERLIGEGTYGEIHQAVHKESGQVVAMKVLDSIHEMIEEIEEEYLVLRDLGNHPNIPRFHGIYLKPPTTGLDAEVWMAMELCGRGSVTHLAREVIGRGEALEEDLIAHILRETLKALLQLHKNHVIHRDVKGHNILINDQGQIKLIDFGVSGHLPSTLARKNTSVGTPYWMAPEVIACERQLEYNYDIRCDIWSLGITAIELADGEPPLSDLHPMRALFKIPSLLNKDQSRNPQPQFTNPDRWSEEFKDFLNQCLIKDFEARPFAQDLLQHPFIAKLPNDTAQFQKRLRELTSKMETTLHEPEITAKKGRLKSRRKSRKENIKTSDDLATLENLDEETIVSQLECRYTQGQIYTYIGDILLAVNPFRPLVIYTEEYSLKYKNAGKDDNPPHIFAVADQSYQSMMHNHKNQCIVISGESGAGKTESANLLVQQLTQLGKAANRTLEDRILQVNPLMEAFGNAKTVINDNSSRFGKYLEMFFTNNGMVVGAKITEYLLEKSRVISQAVGEQNFHVFYYIYDGLSAAERDEYSLKEKTRYKYIDEYSSQNPDISSMSVNKVKFKAIEHCFDIIGFKPEEVKAVYSVICAILHTGNIEFDEKETTDHKGDACVITNMDLVNTVSRLLGIPPIDLVESLTTTGMVARGELIVRDNSVPEAMDARDAMAKALYGRLFSWIVNRINSLLKPSTVGKEDNNLIIGLLDIFGFENFPKNSFEQLLINIANEQIQYYFNQHIFAWEMQEYRAEGLEGVDISFVDNRPLLDMFLMKPLGLLALLDEESHFPKATDMSLVEKFHKNIQNNNYSRPKGNNLTFSIDHYAGTVVYDAMGFLEKNRDRLPGDVVSMLRASQNAVIRSLFSTPLTKTGNLADGSIRSNRQTPASSPGTAGPIQIMAYNSKSSSMGGSRGSGSTSMTKIQQTVATYFRYSLMDLLAKMVAGSPHFVRCIRPNEQKLPDDFEPDKVTIQLRYTGVLETTRIRREGYSHRIPFAEFLKRYAMLAFGWNEKVEYTRDCCYALLDRLNMSMFQLGKSKVFLKYYHIEQLARMFEERNKKITCIQAAVRRFLAINQFHKLKWQREKAVIKIQACIRMHLARNQYKKLYIAQKTSAVQLQKVFRGYMVRKKVKPMIEERKKAATTIQARLRGYFERKKTKNSQKQQESALKIQRVEEEAFRFHKAKKTRKQEQAQRLGEREGAAVLIQSYVRMWLTREKYRRLQDFKFQKEIQLSLFTQQVALYNREKLDILVRNNSRVHSPPGEPPKSPTPQETDIYAVPHKRRAPSPPKSPTKAPPPPKFPTKMEKPPPDVVEERLDHMKKIKELKPVMPLLESSYYDQINGVPSSHVVNGYSHEEEVVDETPQKLNGEVPHPEESIERRREEVFPATSGRKHSPVLIVKAEVHPHPQSQLPDHLKKRGEGKEIMKPENSSYYDEFCQPEKSSYEIPKDQVIDWDIPLVEAHNLSLRDRRKPRAGTEEFERTRAARSIAEAILANGSLASQQQQKQPASDIIKDPASYREEFYKESNRQEMVKTLERQVSNSSAGKWHHRQRQNGEPEREGVPQPPNPPPAPPPPPPMKRDPPTFHIPPPPVEPPPPIPVSVAPPFSIDIPQTNGTPPVSNGIPNGVPSPSALAKVKFQLKPSVIPPTKPPKMNGTADIAQELSNGIDFRGRLRKTNFDPVQGIRRKDPNSVTQVDFRHLLRKTGRINFEDEEEEEEEEE